jgi:hypothetical protein
VVIAMVTPHAVMEVSPAELVAARRWLSESRADVGAEIVAELPPSAVYRAIARPYDRGWPQFQRDRGGTRHAGSAHAEHGRVPRDLQTPFEERRSR